MTSTPCLINSCDRRRSRQTNRACQSPARSKGRSLRSTQRPHQTLFMRQVGMKLEVRQGDSRWLRRWLAVGATANNESERMRASVGGQRCGTSTFGAGNGAGTFVKIDEALAPCRDFKV